MDSKTLLLIPGVIYGVGLADLLKAFKPKIYWEITAMAILLILDLILNWFLFATKIELIGENLLLFALTLTTPMLFTRACNILTPGLNTTDTREHYYSVLKPFFLILAAHVLFNIIIQTTIENDGFNLVRMIGIPLLLVGAFNHKRWVRIMIMITLFGLILYAITAQQIGI